jgi:mono/diheme cytochrome c family protein
VVNDKCAVDDRKRGVPRASKRRAVAWRVLLPPDMGERSLCLILFLTGCVIGENAPPADPDPAPAARTLVTEPVHGSVIAGDPAVLSLHVAGVFEAADRELAVQVLADPADLASWQTIATARSAAAAARSGEFPFAVDVRPVSSAAEAARWPRGGVLRLRVVDDAGRALPYDVDAPAGASDDVPDSTIITVANPGETPAGWTYLMEEAPGSIQETQEYYAAIDAPASLDAFLARYGFPGGETAATYYNAGDLGIGREMHCRATQDPAGGLACYVRNFGTFGGDRGEAIALLEAGGTPLATVAMVYAPPIDAPNAVSFIVYGPNGELINEAQLDTVGNNKSIPQNCLNCHGGRSRYDAAANAVIGARFLPFDPAAFAYSARPELSFAAQEGQFRALNRLIVNAAPTAGVREVVEGMFPAGDAPYDAAFVPAGWSGSRADAKVYREVVAPYCRGCHAAFESPSGLDPLAFPTAADLRARGASLTERLCGAGPRGMPAAEATTAAYFHSAARAVMLPWLGLPGACAPE